MAHGEIRGSVSPRLREGGRCSEGPGKVFLVLQSRTPTSSLSVSDPGGDVLWKRDTRMRRANRGDVRGHARAVFSFLHHPNAKFFVEDPAFAENLKPGIGELAGAMKDWLLKRWSGKGAHTRRPFPTPHPGFFYGVQDYESTFTISGQRSTLKSPDCCLKIGERLSLWPLPERVMSDRKWPSRSRSSNGSEVLQVSRPR